MGGQVRARWRRARSVQRRRRRAGSRLLLRNTLPCPQGTSPHPPLHPTTSTARLPPTSPRLPAPRRWLKWEKTLAYYDRSYGKLLDEWWAAPGHTLPLPACLAARAAGRGTRRSASKPQPQPQPQPKPQPQPQRRLADLSTRRPPRA